MAVNPFANQISILFTMPAWLHITHAIITIIIELMHLNVPIVCRFDSQCYYYCSTDVLTYSDYDAYNLNT